MKVNVRCPYNIEVKKQDTTAVIHLVVTSIILHVLSGV